MKIKWERNSRSVALANKGKIDGADIIPRTQTLQFPAEAATVRMHNLSNNPPHVTLHIRGKSIVKTNAWNNTTWECADTCRVNIGGIYDNSMCSNGTLHEDLSWLDVHNTVTTVKEIMGIK